MDRAIGYIRQSRRADLDVALSPEQQRAEILRLAERDGLEGDLTVYTDLGRSGGQGKESRRSGYKSLIADLESGGVGIIYAKALTRLARSVTELYRILRLAQEHKTKIITSKEGVMDPSTPIGKAQFGMLAVFAEFERDLAVERALDNAATRRARGERMGRAPYGEGADEDVSAVVSAFTEYRSLDGAARFLNEQGVPSPLGRLWSGPSVRNVLQRSAPELLPRRRHHGVKPSSPFLLFRLLRCPCGRILTANRDNRGGRRDVTIYRCHAASVDPGHNRPYRVRESELLPWIKAEAARLSPPEDQVSIVEKDAEERRSLLAARDRLGLAVTDGLLSRDAALAKAGEIDSALERLADEEVVLDIPEIDWSWDAEALNPVLSALWEEVRLDKAMRPVEAVWRIPEWRS